VEEVAEVLVSARLVRGAYEFLADDLDRFCNDPVFIAACKACEIYREKSGRRDPSAVTADPRDGDFEYFDPDELGLDPELDEEVWHGAADVGS